MHKVDDKDIEIINILKADSRASIRDIAKKTGIRPTTVHKRIADMKANGIIERFTVKVNDDAVGRNFVVFMLVATNSIIDKGFFNSSYVVEAFGITGEYDLLIKMKFKGIEEFNSFLIKFRKKYKAKTITMVSTIKIKEEI